MIGEELSFKEKVIKSFLWLGTGSLVGQLVSWASTILVIRLLLPSDYGQMAMATAYTSFLTMITTLGITASLVQAERINEKEIRQVFGVLIIACTVGVILSWLIAPAIAMFFNEKELVPIIRVLSLNFILISLYTIQEHIFIRNMDFKTNAVVDVTARLASSIVTLVLALSGMRVWALVLGLMAMHLAKAIGYNIARSTIVWPSFQFKGARDFVLFGLNVTGSRIFYYFYSQADIIIVGRYLSNSLLGIYSVALSLVSIPMEKIFPIVSQVSFASYSRIQNDIERINRNLLRATRMISLSTFPIFFGMAAVAPEALPMILGSRWESTVYPFQLLCFVLPLKTLSPILPPAVTAIGKPNVNLINMIITSILMAIAFLIGVRAGIIGVCLAWIIAYPIVFVITVMRNLKMLGMSTMKYLSEIAFPFLASISMYLIILSIKKYIVSTHSFYCLMGLIIFGMLYYAGLVLLFRKKDCIDLYDMVKR